MPPLIGRRRRSSRRRGTKAWERYMIIKRAAAYFGREVDEEKAWSSARSITAEELREFLRDLGPGPDFRFSGRFYTVRGSELVEGSSWDEIREAVVKTARVWGESAVRALEILMGADDGLTEREFSAKLKVEGIPYSKEFVRWLLDLGLAVRMPDGRICKLEEAKKPIRDAVEELNSRYRRMDPAARSEMPEIMRMEAEFQAALREALEKRLEEVVEFGRGFSSTTLADRLRSTFGDLLYYDILLAVAQQYSIADAPVVSAATGTVTMRTGFNLALFGEPGTGKSFSIATMILGDERRAIPPHGLPGRNRYCGGMTPAKFIRLGQAYEGLKYNFIVPEFNDWFRYCLTYDSLVLTADGGLVPIGELVERREPLEVLTVNPRTLELEAVRIADFSSREVDRLIELRTESGKLLRLTEDHPLPVMTRQGIIWKPAREFEVGDYVISLTAIPELTANDGGRWRLADFLPEDVNVKVKPELLENLRRAAIKKYGNLKVSSSKLGIKYTTFYSYLTGRCSVPLKTLRRMASELGLKSDVLDFIESASKASSELSLPREIPSTFMYFVGAVMGDGTINQGRRIRLYCPEDPDVVERCLRIAREVFGIGYVDKVGTLYVNNSVLATLLERFGVPAGKKARDVDIPSRVMRMSKDYVRELLRGLFDTDGTVQIRRPYGGRVALSTMSGSLALKVHLLLYRFGITSRIYRSSTGLYTVEIADRISVMRFAEEIGFFSSRKSSKLRSLLERYKGAPRTKTRTIPLEIAAPILISARASAGVSRSEMRRVISDGSLLRWEGGGRGAISKSGLQKYVLVLRRLSPENSSDHALRVAERLALGPLVFEKIVEKRLLTGRFRVYDIAVPGNRNFFANAILVHNSGMVEALKLAMEHGTIRYETARRTIGPYRFTCFLSVAYNTRVGLKGYEVTVSDPNFNAIEERMLCRLHRMTKERYVEIARKQMEMALGKVRLEGSETLRAHLTLVHAAETGHPLVRERLAERPVVVDEGVYEAVSKARDAVLSEIPGDRPGFSPRLEIRAIQLASALALMRYFAEDSEDPIKIDDGSLKLAIRFYVEEAAVRSREMFDPAQVLSKLAVDV